MKGLLCTFRFFWQQLGKQTLKVFLVSWQEQTLRAHFEPFYFSLIHSPFHQNLICGDGLVQYTPEYVQSAPKHQCSVENTRAPSTAGGLVWSRPHYVNNIGLVIVKRALGLKRPRHDERVVQIICFLLAQISPSFFILFSQGHG